MGHFERLRYPDGQISAKWVAGQYDNNPLARRKGDSVLKQRINSYEDLFFVRACADVLQHQGVGGWSLFIPCMFGQRSDRRFVNFQSFDLKLITDIINECGFDEVEILDPHSDVTMALIENSAKRSSFEYVEKSVKDVMEKQLLTDGYMTDILLVSPDAGAYKKVFEYGEKLNLPVVGAMKHRDKEGNVNLLFSHDVTGKDCFIVDDLCDGGYTFITLGKRLKESGARKVYLYVSHGLFSKGFETLTAVIDHIYCTNSIRDEHELTQDFLTQYKII
mgnify:CR=1 FL=1